MKLLLTNPVVLICSGIIVAGIVGLFWAIAKFRSLPSSSQSSSGPADLFPGAPELREIDFRTPAASAGFPARGAGATPAVSRDVAERLDSMSQRLSEMQTVLTKQSSLTGAGAAGSAGPGGVGQGFSPETIDKLLKIIGNVMQQVDILQKSVSGGK